MGYILGLRKQSTKKRAVNVTALFISVVLAASSQFANPDAAAARLSSLRYGDASIFLRCAVATA